MNLGYIRVSRRTQKVARQVDGLEPHCDEVLVERLSAAARQRPVFEAAIARLAAGDTFVILDLDRAFRSTIDAIVTAEALRARGVQLHIVNANIDTSTEFGEVIYGIMALLGQFERRTLMRRTREGLDAARRRGTKLGPRFRLDTETIIEAHRRVTMDERPITDVARDLSVSYDTLRRGFRRLDLAA